MNETGIGTIGPKLAAGSLCRARSQVSAVALGMAVPLFPIQEPKIARGLAWVGCCGH